MHFSIVGTSRTGSTLLRQLIQSTGQAVVFNETHWLPILQRIHGHEKQPFTTFLTTAKEVTWQCGSNLIDLHIDGHAISADKARDRFSTASRINAPMTVTEFHETIKDIIFADHPQKSIWGDKTPDYGPNMQHIQRLWPDCRFIHITRNPFTTAQSMQKHPGCQLLIDAKKTSWVDLAHKQTYESFEKRAVSMIEAIDHWFDKMAAIEKAKRQLSPNTYLEISYEQLIKKPDETLQTVFTFLNLPFEKSADYLELKKTIHTKSLNKNIDLDNLLKLPLRTLKRLPKQTLKNNHTSISHAFVAMIEAFGHQAWPEFIEAHYRLVSQLLETNLSACEHWLSILADLLQENTELWKVFSAHANLDITPLTIESIRLHRETLSSRKAYDLECYLLGTSIYLFPCVDFNLWFLQRLLGGECYQAVKHFGTKASEQFPDKQNLLRPQIRNLLFTNAVTDAKALLTKGKFNSENPSDIPLFFDLAMRRNDYALACGLSETLLKHNPQNIHHWAMRARALSQAGKEEHAEALLLEGCQKFEVPIALLNPLSHRYQQRQDWPMLTEILTQIAQLQPNPTIRKRLANALVSQGNINAATRWIDQLPASDQKQVKAKWAQLDMRINEAQQLLSQPENLEESLNLIDFHLQTDFAGNAQQVLDSLDPLALKGNHKLRFNSLKVNVIAHLEGITPALDLLNHLIAENPKHAPYLNLKSHLLTKAGKPEKALALLENNEIASKAPWFPITLANLLIINGQFERAHKLIGDLPDNDYRLPAVRLKAWAAAQQNDHSSAKALWQAYTSRNYIKAIQPVNNQLTLLSTLPTLAPDDIVLYTVCRNEAKRLESFFSHYRALGVTHFVVVDNDSTDGSIDWLIKQKDVTLYHTGASYKSACYGMQWVNYLKRELSPAHWCLYVDLDELLLIPTATPILKDVTNALDQEGAEAACGFMLDVFTPTKHKNYDLKKSNPLLDHELYFDNNYQVNSCSHAPYLEIYGGFRQRFFWQSKERGNPLVKTPLVKGSAVDFLSSSHVVSPAKISSTQLVLTHFKYPQDCEARFAEEVKRREHASITSEYERYMKILWDTDEHTSLLDKHSLRYKGAEQLEQLGLINSGKLRTSA